MSDIPPEIQLSTAGCVVGPSPAILKVTCRLIESPDRICRIDALRESDSHGRNPSSLRHPKSRGETTVCHRRQASDSAKMGECPTRLLPSR